MRSTILAVAAGLALFLGSAFASAQSDKTLAINVPFDFMVGKTMFPAGAYTVKSPGPHTFVLKARDGYEFVVMKTRPVVLRNQPVLIALNSHDSGLLFVNDGHHYRLQKVRINPTREELLAKPPVAGNLVWVGVPERRSDSLNN